jgi:hypothetical protein
MINSHGSGLLEPAYQYITVGGDLGIITYKHDAA